jgi:hypothetical protein
MENDHSIFFCYAKEDRRRVRRVYNNFVSAGYNVWMDVCSLPPGAIWEDFIPEAIKSSRIFMFFVTKNSCDKIGYLRTELNEARKKQIQYTEGDIFIVPVKLEKCAIPRELRRFQAVDYFKKQGKSMIWTVLRDKIGPGLPTPIRDFWSPVIKKGCTIIVGSQPTKLDNIREIRPVTGKFDNIALGKLTNFLGSVIRPNQWSISTIEVEHMTMPRSINRIKPDVRRSMKYYEDNLSNLINRKENIISLGMPCVNPATEMLLSKAYRVKAFSPSRNPKMKRGFIVNDTRKIIKSSLYVDQRDKDQGIMDSKAENTLCRYKSTRSSCGIILKYVDKGCSVIVISGYNGIATIGGVKILTEEEHAVNFMNMNQGVSDYEDGFLYTVEYKTIKNENRDFDGRILSTSLLSKNAS